SASEPSPMRVRLPSLFPLRPAALTLGTILVAALLDVSGTPLLDWLELKTYDLRLRSRGPVRPFPAVELAVIDEKSLATEGRWPWPRSKLAALVDLLSRDATRVIGFDMAFVKPDTYTPNDLTLTHAITQSSATVVL